MVQSIHHPNRRQFLGALAVASGSLTCAGPALAASAESAWRSSTRPYDGPLSKSFDGYLSCPQLDVQGKIPQNLSGLLVRNGPARMRIGNTQYQHWFDGDGMLQGFRFDNGKISHHGALLRTPKMTEEDAAGHFLYPGFGSQFTDSRPLRSPDTINVANINVLPMNHGRNLYALWEAGSALEVDTGDFSSKGFKVWSPQTAGAPFSAHPRVEPDGTVWNFGYMPGSGKLILYHITSNGQLKRQTMIDAPQADMVHDFATTENYLVFLLMPLQIDQQDKLARTLLDRYRWKEDQATIALVVNKSDWSVRRFEIPNSGLFHIGNAWEEGGIIHLHYARQADIYAELHAMNVEQPATSGPNRQPQWVNVEINLHSGKATQKATSITAIEFPRWDQRYTSSKTRYHWMLQRSKTMHEQVFGFNTVLSVQGERVQKYDYGHEWIAEEHLFVPESAFSAEAKGWVLGTAYHWPSERTQISIFDATHINDGPIATARLHYALPLGLHGQFIPS